MTINKDNLSGAQIKMLSLQGQLVHLDEDKQIEEQLRKERMLKHHEEEGSVGIL